MNTISSPLVPSPWPSLPRGRRGLVLLAALALHGGLLAFALGTPPAVPTAMVPLPVSVRLINALPTPKPQPAVTPPLPQPPRAVKTPLPRAPAPVPVTPMPSPVLAAAPAAAASSSFAVAEAARPAPAAPAAAPTLTQARFDADYLHNPKPLYPPMSRRLGEEGKVLLKVRVTAQGTAEQVDIQTGSGYARLDAAARDAVLRWRFVPARRGDEAVAASVIVPITFALDG